MAVELLTESTPEIIETMGRFIPQLPRSAKSLDAQAYERLTSRPGVHFFIYRPDTTDAQGEHPILGMLSLVIFEIPTDVRAWIKDVIIDEATRGRGAGFRSVEAALEQTKRVGARTVDLTSRPSCEVVNRLYRRIGFGQRETNVYRVLLG